MYLWFGLNVPGSPHSPGSWHDLDQLWQRQDEYTALWLLNMHKKNITYTQLGKTSRNAARIYGSHREDILEFRLWIYYSQQLLSLPAGCVSEMMHSSRFGRKPTPMLPSSHGSRSGTWQPSSTSASQRQQLSQIICAHDMGASPARDNPKFAYRATFAWNTACGRCGTGVAWQTKMR